MTQIYCEIMENCEELATKERVIDGMNYWGCRKHLRMSPVKIKHIWERDRTGKHPNQKTLDDYR